MFCARVDLTLTVQSWRQRCSYALALCLEIKPLGRFVELKRDQACERTLRQAKKTIGPIQPPMRSRSGGVTIV